MTVSDVLSIADAQMYIKKRDYHILMSKKRLREERFKNTETTVGSVPPVDSGFSI